MEFLDPGPSPRQVSGAGDEGHVFHVRILYSHQPPVQRTYSSLAWSDLVSLGSGGLFDSNGKAVVEDELLPGTYTYAVAAAEAIDFGKLTQVELPPPDGPLNRLSLLVALALAATSARHSTDAVQELMRIQMHLTLATEEWVEAVIEAVKGSGAKPLSVLEEYMTADPRVRPEFPTYSVHELLKQAWSGDYKDELGIVDKLYQELLSYRQRWQGGHYLAAWTSIIQSSGWGKSRTVCHLWTKGVYVVYVSFMKKGWSGIPPRSLVADIICNADAKDPRLIAAWVSSMLAVLVSKIKDGQDPQQWLHFQNTDEYRDSVQKWYDLLKVRVIKTVEDVQQGWNRLPLLSWMQSVLLELFKDSTDVKILICFDEAGSFFDASRDYFVAARRFFSCIPSKPWIFGLVMDTAAKLGLIFPEAMYDPSARARLPETKHFDPLWFVGTLQHDNLSTLLDVMNKELHSQGTSAAVSRELYMIGRPLWKALLEKTNPQDEVQPEEAVAFACQKLLAGGTMARLETGLSQGSYQMPEAMGMALVGIAAGVEVAAWADVAKSMVASHMRTVSYISKERDQVFSADVAEPILGEAAARILNVCLPHVLQTVADVCKKALVVEGSREELVGRLVSVLAMHECCRTRYTPSAYNTYSQSVQLKDYLEVLLGNGIEVKARGVLRFNRFILLNRDTITRHDLLVCFVLCLAIVPKRGQQAYDALLPRLMPGEDGEYELREDRMTAIALQFKNKDSYTENSKRLGRFAAYFNTFDASVLKKDVPLQELQRLKTVPRTSRDLVGLAKVENESQLDVADAPVAKMRTITTEVNADEVAAFYFHLHGKKRSKRIEVEGGGVYIVHRLQNIVSFLKDQEATALQDLLVSFFDIQECYRTSPWKGVAFDIFDNYFKWKSTPSSLWAQ